LIFDQVTQKNKLAPFLWPTVYMQSLYGVMTISSNYQQLIRHGHQLRWNV